MIHDIVSHTELALSDWPPGAAPVTALAHLAIYSTTGCPSSRGGGDRGTVSSKWLLCRPAMAWYNVHPDEREALMPL